nr:hypothetical protein [Tanacetum cinerariifolium]
TAKGKQPARATSPADPLDVERTRAEQLKIILRRSRHETHISQQDVDDQTKGSDDNKGEKTDESDDDDNDQDEAENDNDDNDDEEEISKIDEHEATESGEGDDEETESDGENEEQETREEAEESFDPIPRTPEDNEDTGNGEKDQGLRISEEERIHEEEEPVKLYRDVDINQGRGLQVSKDIDDSHVTLTPVHSDGQQESSSTTASQPPIPPAPIPSEVLQNLLTFESVFRFKNRVKSLEVNFSEFMWTNQSPKAVSNILDEQRNLYKALVEAYEADKTILDSYGESAIPKRGREDDDDQERPSTGSDRGSKRRRKGRVHASANTLSKPATRSAGRLPVRWRNPHIRKPPTPDRDWNKTLPAIQGSAQSWISELAKQTDARSSFNKLLDTSIDFSNFIMNWLGVDTLTPELLAGPTYELMRGHVIA